MRSPNLSIALSAAVSLCLFALVLFYCDRGLSLSDESYYLNVIKRFGEISYSVEQSGFLLRPIFAAVGESIFTIRLVNISLSYALCVGLALLVFEDLAPVQRFCLAIGIACAALTVLNGWLPSPSYNSLVPQAALAAAIGLSLTLRKECSTFGPVLIGLSGAIIFLCKPTSAVALAALMPICLGIGGRLHVRSVTIAAVTAGSSVLLVAILISGSVPAFVDRLLIAYADAVLGQSGHHLSDVLRIDRMLLGKKNIAAMIATLVIVATGTWLASRARCSATRFELALVTAGLVLIAIIAVLAPRQNWPVSLAADQYWRLVPLAVATGAVLGAIASLRMANLAIDRRTLATMVFLAALPFVAVVGTSQNYWSAASPVSVCWTLAALRYIVSICGLRVAVPALVAAQVIAFATILIWMTSPYEQSQSLFDQKNEISIGRPASHLIVGSDVARYVQTLQVAAAEAGLSRNDAFMNLTGDTPGADLVLDTELLGEVWLIGGLPGSTDRTRAILKRVPCAKLDAAWLLTATDGPHGIDPAALGISLDRYRPVTPAAAPRLGYPDGVEHRLFKPIAGTHLPTAVCKSR